LIQTIDSVQDIDSIILFSSEWEKRQKLTGFFENWFQNLAGFRINGKVLKAPHVNEVSPFTFRLIYEDRRRRPRGELWHTPSLGDISANKRIAASFNTRIEREKASDNGRQWDDNGDGRTFNLIVIGTIRGDDHMPWNAG
jgi:hypothetical protein